MTDTRPPLPKIRAVPQVYKGVRFASTLEADWAATFDSYQWSWAYEPVAFRLTDDQMYRCDFWLPGQRAWCEVKGPHQMRMDKPRQLYKDLMCDQDDWRTPIVLICREPEHAGALVERADGEPIGLEICGRCDHYTFVDLAGAWQCRVCGNWDKKLSQADWPGVPESLRTRQLARMSMVSAPHRFRSGRGGDA